MHFSPREFANNSDGPKETKQYQDDRQQSHRTEKKGFALQHEAFR